MTASTIETLCIDLNSGAKGLTSAVLLASLIIWTFLPTVAMSSHESKSVLVCCFSLLATVFRHVSWESTTLLSIFLQTHWLGTVPGFYTRFASDSISPPSEENFIGSSHPYFHKFPRMIFNAGVEAFSWVALEVTDEAKALTTLSLALGTSFFIRDVAYDLIFLRLPLCYFLHSSDPLAL